VLTIFFIADIIGKPGRKALNHRLPHLIEAHHIDLIIANGENAAGGFGITGETARELLRYGIDCITTGNHVWDHKDVIPFLTDEARVIRPANLPIDNPGRGVYQGEKKGVPYAVINLLGRVYMGVADCPFRTADRELSALEEHIKVRIVDIHGEATSEKQALGFYLDGRVTAVLGTHTHVATDDLKILPGGTAFISDAGMTGPTDSIIGMKKDLILKKFLTTMPVRYEVASGPAMIEGVIIRVSDEGKAQDTLRIREFFDS
jgi:2',3'-cyclic-nucleotide 2'-phosphodiesterase